MGVQLIGKAPLTVVRFSGGSRANVPAGQPVPESVDPDDAARLVKEGFLSEVEPDKAKPAGKGKP